VNETTTMCDEEAVLCAAIASAAEPTAIVMNDDEDVLVLAWANRTFSESVRVARHELAGEPLGDFVWGADQLPLNELRSTEFPLTVQGRDGSTSAWDAAAIPTNEGGRVAWVLTLRPPAGRDLDELLRASEERFRALAERAPVGIFSSEVGLRINYVNDWLSELLGTPAEQLLGTSWMDRVRAEDLDAVTMGLQETLAGTPLDLPCRFETASGEVRWVNMRAIGVHQPGKPATFLGTIEDVTERRQFEELLAWQATHDPLTGLPNRAELTAEISAAIATEAETTAVLFFDLDGFKEVNDTMGHAAGDALLIAVADRLRDAVRGTDIVFRLAGDEFVILAHNVRDDAEAMAVAERLRKAVARPVTIGDAPVRIGCSVGVVRADTTTSADEMLRDADVAMYEAKRTGKGRTAVLDNSAKRERDDRIRFVEELRDAVAEGAILVDFLPIVDTVSRLPVGVEALARWNHPERGTIEAEEFVPIACQAGIVTELGNRVLAQACASFSTWKANGLAPDYLAVNVSGVELMTPGFVDSMARTVLAGGMTSRDVCFEISDSDLVAEPDAVIPVLHEIARLGFRIALDDFGSSFASLVHLPHLPLDMLKIDHALLEQAITTPATAALLRATVRVCDELSLPTVAEGVRDEDILALAAEAGVTFVQGHAISPAMGLHDATRWLGEGAR